MTQKQARQGRPRHEHRHRGRHDAALMHRTADEAYYAYRERRLQDRYDLDPSDQDHDASEILVDAEVVDDSEEPLDIIGLLDEAQRESAADVDE